MKLFFADGNTMDDKKRDYSDIIDMESPSMKVPLSGSERASQYLAFEAVRSGRKLLDMGEEIWLKSYAPEDYRREIYKKRRKKNTVNR